MSASIANGLLKFDSYIEKKKDAIDASNGLFKTPEAEQLPTIRKRKSNTKRSLYEDGGDSEDCSDIDEGADIVPVSSNIDKAVTSKKSAGLKKKAKVGEKSLQKKKPKENGSVPKSKKKTPALKDPSKDLMKLSCAQLVSDIVAPLSTSKAITKQSEVVNQVDSSSESDYISDSDVQEKNDEDQQMTPRHSPHASLIPIHTPQVGINATSGSSKLPALKPSTRPQVGGKTPKSSFPPRKCINVSCKEEKQELRNNIAALKQQIEDLKAASSSKAQRAGLQVLTPAGKIDAEEAAHRGLSEIAQGVWCCPVKVKALINSVTSRTSLACGLLNLFYPKQVLSGKRLRELDQTIVNAIADFAVVAKIPTPPESQDKGKKGSSGNAATRGEVLQSLRSKCNALVFQGQRPTYHKEKYEQKKKTLEEAPITGQN